MRIVCAVFLAVAAVPGQEPAADRVTVPFSDPSRPRTVKVSTMNGGIAVRASSGNEVILESRGGQRHVSRRGEAPDPKAQGLRRIDTPNAGLRAEEQDNVVTISAGAMGHNADLTLQVPANAALQLKTLNGDISVEGVSGEVDANALSGKITLNNVAGAVVAHSLNRDVSAVLTQAPAGKPMSFTSLNGSIDVTLPPDTKARLKMKTNGGDIYSDFDINMEAASKPATTDDRKAGGKYRVHTESTMYGTINGGGPEITLTTFRGNIYLRKKK